MPSERKSSWLDGVEQILRAKTRDLKTLADLAGLDARTMYIGTRMDGADLSGQDLRGIAFTNLDRSMVVMDEKTLLDDIYAVATEDKPKADALILILEPEWEEGYYRLRPGRAFRHLTMFGPHELVAFWEACETFDGPKLIFASARSGPPLRPFRFDSAGRKDDAVTILGIETRSNKLGRVTHDVLDELGGPTILVPMSSPVSRRYGPAFPAAFTDLIGFAIRFWPELSRIVFFRTLVSFLSARSDAADDDAVWYKLYARASKLGLQITGGTRLQVRKARKAPSLAPELLFPDASDIELQSSRDWPSFDAAVLIDGPALRDSPAAYDYERIVSSVLRHNGWNVLSDVDILDAGQRSELDFRAVGERLTLDIDVRLSGRGPRTLETHARSLPISAAGGLEVSEAADANAILQTFNASQKLLVNLQDLRWLDVKAETLWSVVAHQARRLSRGLGGQARSLYFAALMRTAVLANRVFQTDGARFVDRIGLDDFGRIERFEISALGLENDRVAFKIKLIDFAGERGFQTFVLGIDPDGPFIDAR